MALDGDPVIRNCIFINNEADYGGALFFNVWSHPVISKCLIYNNQAYSAGGGIFAEVEVIMDVVNCTISHNYAPSGGGIEIRDSDIELINSIISFSGSGEALAVRGNPRIEIEYSDLFGNADGDWTGPIADLLGQYGNISLDPLFIDTLNADLHLTENSPCVDAGDPSFPYDPDGTIADIGAFYFDQMVDIRQPDFGIPASFTLYPNYPNPFNARTTINYSLPQPSDVSLEIYDLLGRKVQTIYTGNQNAGEYSLMWDAAEFSSGVYIYKLTAGGFEQSGKMTLLK